MGTSSRKKRWDASRIADESRRRTHMRDPYASADAASQSSVEFGKLGPAFGSAWTTPAPGAAPLQQPDFLFEETADAMYRRSWGDRLTYHIGVGYLVGAAHPSHASGCALCRLDRPLAVHSPPPPPRLARSAHRAAASGLVAGGSWGLYEGLKSSTGERQRIRINAVLNATGKHGPGLGNSVGCLGMMFSTFETLAFNFRGEDDMLNVMGAGALAGGIFKSQARRGPGVWEMHTHDVASQEGSVCVWGGEAAGAPS